MPNLTEHSDELLIKRTAEGSKTAFETLMNRYIQVVYSYISLRASEADASDILQETMLAAWKGIPGFDRLSSLKTWLLSIARRKLCDFYRSESRHRTVELPEYAMDSDECGDYESDNDVSSEVSERLDAAEAIKSLNVDERELVFMVFEAGLSYAHISQVTGIPVGTVKSRMSAVRAKLKRFLGEDYYAM